MVGMLVALALAAGEAVATVTSGQLLTNFTSATYALPSGSGVDATSPGVSIINIPNGASCWVLVTDAPQLCMKLWKTAIADPYGAPVGTGVYPGDMLCFQIGFSNCGGYTGWSVHVTDVLPANTVKSPSMPFSLWVAGGYQSISTPWAKDLGGPWYLTSNAGQTAPLYMRWLLGKVGMGKTGYIRYCVSVL